MKKYIFSFLVILMYTGFILSAQNKITNVVLKNGTTLSGELKEIEALSHILINIGGVVVKIEMEEIAFIQSRKTDNQTMPEVVQQEIQPVIDDSQGLPDSLVFRVGEEQLVMVLVRGGEFEMGFDGRGSLKMKSEPVHRVRLSSYYISKTPLTNGLVFSLSRKKGSGTQNDIYFPTFCPANYKRKLTQEIIERLNEKLEKTFRLPTEAEWEYIATSSYRQQLFYWNGLKEFCSDFFDDYPTDIDILINPTGPKEGKAHVIRTWNVEDNEIFRRSSEEYDSIAIRVVLPVSEI